jgi:beta-lactamase regulating signal transducer with metallopeptidase domain
LFNDLWKYSPLANQWTWVSGNNTVNVTGVYGTKGVPSLPSTMTTVLSSTVQSHTTPTISSTVQSQVNQITSSPSTMTTVQITATTLQSSIQSRGTAVTPVGLIAGIVGGIGGTLLLAGIILVIFILIRKNKQKENKTYSRTKKDIISTLDVKTTTIDLNHSSLPLGDDFSQGN